jgi:hypothetical protein
VSSELESVDENQTAVYIYTISQLLTQNDFISQAQTGEGLKNNL